MTTIFLVLASIVIFFIGIFSPTQAKKIQVKTDKIARRLNKGSDRFWNPITFVAQSSIEWIRKIINFSARSGGKTRKRFSRKKKTSKKS